MIKIQVVDFFQILQGYKEYAPFQPPSGRASHPKPSETWVNKYFNQPDLIPSKKFPGKFSLSFGNGKGFRGLNAFKMFPQRSDTQFDVRKQRSRGSHTQMSKDFRHLLGAFYTSDMELINLLDKAGLDIFTPESLAATLKGFVQLAPGTVASEANLFFQEKLLGNMKTLKQVRQAQSVALLKQTQQIIMIQERRNIRDRAVNVLRNALLEVPPPSNDQIDEAVASQNLLRIPYLPKDPQNLLSFQKQMYKTAVKIRSQLFSFYAAVQNRQNLWISLLNIPRRYSQEFLSFFPNTSRQDLRWKLMLALFPLKSDRMLAGFIAGTFPQTSLSRPQLFDKPVQKIHGTSFQNVVLNYLKHSNPELYQWFKSFSKFQPSKQIGNTIDMIYFQGKNALFSKQQKDFVFIGRDDPNSLYLPRISQALAWAVQYRNQMMRWISNLLSLVYEHATQQNQRMTAQQLHSFVTRKSSETQNIVFTFSGQRYWTSKGVSISSVQPMNYHISFPLNAGSFQQLSIALRQALLAKIDSQSDQVYINLQPIIIFNSITMKVQSRQRFAQVFSHPYNFTQMSRKFYQVISQTIHQKNSVQKDLIPAVHGWVKQIAFEDQAQVNCLLDAMQTIAAHNNYTLTAMQIANIRVGWAIQVCINHNWPVFLASMPSYQPVIPQKDSMVLYVMPYHSFAIQSQRLKRQFSQERSSKYVFGKPRSGDQDLQLFNNSICFDVQAYAIEQEVQQIYLLTWWGRIDGKQNAGMLSTSVQNPLSGAQIMQAFIQWLLYTCSLPHRFGKTLYVYSYNGPKYQFRYLIRPLSARVQQIKSFGNVSASKGLTCLNGALVFRDPKFLFGGGSLKDNSQSFNPPDMKKIDLQKLVPPVQLPKTFEDYINNKAIIDQYCLADSKAAMCLVYSFFQNLQMLLKQVSPEMQVDVSQFFNDWTAPQVAIHILQTVFCKGYNIQPEVDLQYLRAQQQSNFGGMVGGCYTHFERPVVSCDLCSAYPAAMTKPLPFSRISSWQAIQKNQLNNIFFKKPQAMLTLYQCSEITFSQHQHPFIPVRGEEALTYPTQILQKTFCWGVTLSCLLRHGGSVKLVRRVRYSSKDSGWAPKKDKAGRQPTQVHGFRNFNLSLYKLRKQYKALFKQDEEVNFKYSVLQLLVKLFLNSSYGKFNQRKFQGKSILTTTQQDITLQYINLQYHGGFSVGTTANTQHSNSGNLVRLSSYITSLVRVQLTQAIQCVGKHNVAYFDTDSMYFFEQQLPLMSQKLTTNGQLGMFQQQKYRFSQGIILGPKMRFFKTSHLYDNQFVSINSKTKGVSFNDKKQQKELQKLYQQVKKKILQQDIGYEAGVKSLVYQMLQEKRWVWDKPKTGNVIQKYPKKINFYQRKVRVARNYMRHLTWEQYKKL